LVPPGAEPIAQAYAGHQFGGFTVLGDGRAILLGEQITPAGGRVDVQLKGPGPTAYSRRGDGRAALGPMLREYVVSEAMHALGVPTTRSLAVVTTGEPVYRERPLRGAVLTRVAASHIRVGTFQLLAARRDVPALRALADHTIERHYPHLTGSARPYLELFRAVAERQAALVARWQLVGFVHGVLNTDNVAVSGETIDYGPCAFVDAYDPAAVFSSIDDAGRYAYANQPGITQWNLARFAEALLPLIDPDGARAVELATEELNRFPGAFEAHRLSGLRAKLGLRTAAAGDADLAADLLDWMHATRADFTNTFRALAGEVPGGERAGDPAFAAWAARWVARLALEGETPVSARARLCAANPAVIPRNHRVEEALAAAEREDLGPLDRL
ncbi:MAG: YdiU family protein, partial [Thermoleophilia bacterium]|nr:YdiU family protein [Thermoleophilia bacterium]